MSHLVVGTAGHIDHGKSSLVLALTGTDPDRLPEERRRKITIDLGYAFLNDEVAIIDVPGHEKFVRNMVAGAATVDYAILVIAADDGVMPQTTEHLHILRLLGIRAGCIVITKIDIADAAWIDLVEEQIRDNTRGTFLEGASIHRVDSLSGKGIPEFKTSLLKALADCEPRENSGLFRLPIDRVFSLKGHGTVVTGTVLSGSVKKNARLVPLPNDNEIRVKQVESQGKSAESIGPGRRAALNLIGDVKNLERGQLLTEPGALRVSSRLRIAIELLPAEKPLKERQRLRFLIGTDELLGRIQILRQDAGQCFANLLLEKPVAAAWGDHFILRRYSPMETIGGGRVLEPQPPRLRAAQKEVEAQLSAKLDCASREEAMREYLLHRGRSGLTVQLLAQGFALPVETVENWSRTQTQSPLLRIQDYLIPVGAFDICCDKLIRSIETHLDTHPGTVGVSPAELRDASLAQCPAPIMQEAIERLVARNVLSRSSGALSLADREIKIPPQQQKLVDSLQEILLASNFAPPVASNLAEQLAVDKSAIEKALVLMEKLGMVRRLGTDLFFNQSAFDSAVANLRSALQNSSGLTVAEISKLLNSSRKYVVPLLEHLDAQGVTRREGNLRLPGDKLLT